jgi:hypothetical protein
VQIQYVFRFSLLRSSDTYSFYEEFSELLCVYKHNPLFLSDIKEFRERFSKKAQKLNFMKMPPVGAELFHADRQTDIKEPIIDLRNFAKAL